MYKGKANTKVSTSIHRLQNKHPNYEVSNEGTRSGATVRSITEGLPKTDFGSYDVTLIVCMLNDIAESQITSFAETSTLGMTFLTFVITLTSFDDQSWLSGDQPTFGALGLDGM